ncbi:RNA-binding protein [Candidatus Micrarchaeota archaeon]|nr:RNA-binding protein [Candidatus Micrarchaeota archaeon]
MSLKNCSSCGKQTRECVEFICPACGEEKIVRCKHCREIVNPYSCKKCGRTGP